jgi:hypothetical protein
MITRDTVENVVNRLDEECKEGDILLIQWLENSSFYMFNGETGGMDLPKRDESDGIFHIRCSFSTVVSACLTRRTRTPQP